MKKRTIPEQVKQFRASNPELEKLILTDVVEIAELGDELSVIETAFYFGYMKGVKATRGGVEHDKA